MEQRLLNQIDAAMYVELWRPPKIMGHDVTHRTEEEDVYDGARTIHNPYT